MAAKDAMVLDRGEQAAIEPSAEQRFIESIDCRDSWCPLKYKASNKSRRVLAPCHKPRAISLFAVWLKIGLCSAVTLMLLISATADAIALSK
jgi:hypothetical protein